MTRVALYLPRWWWVRGLSRPWSCIWWRYDFAHWGPHVLGVTVRRWIDVFALEVHL